jgi:hypothetical protein
MMSTTAKPAGRSLARSSEPPADDVDRIVGALRGLRYGAVTVIVQDGVIVQVERTEKLRVTRSAAATA